MLHDFFQANKFSVRNDASGTPRSELQPSCFLAFRMTCQLAYKPADRGVAQMSTVKDAQRFRNFPVRETVFLTPCLAYFMTVRLHDGRTTCFQSVLRADESDGASRARRSHVSRLSGRHDFLLTVRHVDNTSRHQTCPFVLAGILPNAARNDGTLACNLAFL